MLTREFLNAWAWGGWRQQNPSPLIHSCQLNLILHSLIKLGLDSRAQNLESLFVLGKETRKRGRWIRITVQYTVRIIRNSKLEQLSLDYRKTTGKVCTGTNVHTHNLHYLGLIYCLWSLISQLILTFSVTFSGTFLEILLLYSNASLFLPF